MLSAHHARTPLPPDGFPESAFEEFEVTRVFPLQEPLGSLHGPWASLHGLGLRCTGTGLRRRRRLRCTVTGLHCTGPGVRCTGLHRGSLHGHRGVAARPAGYAARATGFAPVYGATRRRLRPQRCTGMWLNALPSDSVGLPSGGWRALTAQPEPTQIHQGPPPPNTDHSPMSE